MTTEWKSVSIPKPMVEEIDQELKEPGQSVAEWVRNAIIHYRKYQRGTLTNLADLEKSEPVKEA